MVQNQNKRIFFILYELCQKLAENHQQEQAKTKETITKLSSEVKNLIEKVNKNDKLQGITNEQINKEMIEIFGNDNLDLDAVKEKIEKLKNRERIPAADVLKDILEQLNKEQYIPDHKTQILPSLDMQEYKETLQEKFKSIQISTAQKILKYFDSGSQKTENFTQTALVWVDPDSFKETKELLDKVTLQFQSATLQLDKLKVVNNENESKITALIEEKTKIYTDNVMKNGEIQSLQEKEKILKQKLGMLRKDKEEAYPLSPYLKENSFPSVVKPLSPVEKKENNGLERVSESVKKDERLSINLLSITNTKPEKSDDLEVFDDNFKIKIEKNDKVELNFDNYSKFSSENSEIDRISKEESFYSKESYDNQENSEEVIKENFEIEEKNGFDQENV